MLILARAQCFLRHPPLVRLARAGECSALDRAVSDRPGPSHGRYKPAVSRSDVSVHDQHCWEQRLGGHLHRSAAGLRNRHSEPVVCWSWRFRILDEELDRRGVVHRYLLLLWRLCLLRLDASCVIDTQSGRTRPCGKEKSLICTRLDSVLDLAALWLLISCMRAKTSTPLSDPSQMGCPQMHQLDLGLDLGTTKQWDIWSGFGMHAIRTSTIARGHERVKMQ